MKNDYNASRATSFKDAAMSELTTALGQPADGMTINEAGSLASRINLALRVLSGDVDISEVTLTASVKPAEKSKD